MTSWAPAGHDTLIRAVRDHLAAGSSALVVGGRGSGRSLLLAAVEDRVPEGTRVLTIRAREGLAGVPLGPWVSVIARHDVPAAEPLRIYSELPAKVLADVDLLVVDDVDLLDAGSALLVVLLARAGLPVLASTTSTTTVPDQLRDLVLEWPAHEVRPLSDAQIMELSSAVAGERLVAPTTSTLVAWSQGVPAVAVTIVRASVEAGRLVRTEAGTMIVDPVVPDAVLTYVGVASEVAVALRQEVELLAVTGGLPVDAVAEETLTGLVRAGLVDVVDGAVQLAHPVVAAWSLHGLGPAELSRLYGRASDLVEQHLPGSRLVSHLGVCAGRPADGLAVVEAADWLMDHHRTRAAKELVATADIGDDPVAGWHLHLTRSRAHRELGERGAALAALDAAVDFAQSDEHFVELVQRWEAILGGRVTDDDALEERVSMLVPLIVGAESRDAVRAILQRRRVILGERRADPAREPASDPIVMLLREAMGGSLGLARSHFVPPPDEQVRDDEDLDELLQVLGRFLGLVYNGDLVEGRAEADHYFERALSEARPSLGLWSYNRTKIAFHAGEHAIAVARGREMRRHLAWRDVAGQALPGEALFAAALARAGHLSEALAIVDGLGAEEALLPRVLLGINRVRAERLLDQGRPVEAARLLLTAGEHALDKGEGHSGLLALDEAWVLDPRSRAGDLLVDLADMSAIAAAMADRVHATRDGEAALLEAVAGRFARMPLHGRAARSWYEASLLHQRQGDLEAARRCHTRSVLLCSEQGISLWPPSGSRPLTPREFEIARLAADRIRSKEIADRLGVSVRTVDNHLARIYQKLGVTGRDELVPFLGQERDVTA